MTYDATLAVIRYGTGLNPRFGLPSDLDAVLADLDGPDEMADNFKIPGFDRAEPAYAAMYWLNQAAREAIGTPQEEAAQRARAGLRMGVSVSRRAYHLMTLARAVEAPIGLRERLTAFWADHFTVRRRFSETDHLVTTYVADAIRPHITGSFRDMLRAVVQHPMMLIYLEQNQSIGPQSDVGKRQGRGLNENLARELLELHLLGVDGAYTQADVSELAELLTGLRYLPYRGFGFEKNRAEPGAETVLGRTFDADAQVQTVENALDTLAVLPQTAQHLAHKMAVHFVAMSPPAEMVDAMARAYLAGDGDLHAMTVAMLTHPEAFAPDKQKVRLPSEFITAALRALGMPGGRVRDLTRFQYNSMISRPLQIMGQPWERPPGPDGWEEDPAAWIIPQGMAGRISWAMSAPRRLIGSLPDPRDFVAAALGDHATQDVIFAAGAAENRSEGVGVILASAAFQRR